MISLLCPSKLPSVARVQFASSQFGAAALNAAPQFHVRALRALPHTLPHALHHALPHNLLLSFHSLRRVLPK